MTDGPRVALDLQAAQSRTFGERGIARWSMSYAAAVAAAGVPLEAVLLHPHLPRPSLPPELDASAAWNTRAEAATWAGRDVAYHVLSPFERGRPVDLLLPAHALDASRWVVATLYDAIPFALAGWYLNDDATRRFMEARRRVLARADLVLAISEHSRRDGIELLGLDPDRVVTVGSGGSPWFTPAAPDDDPGARVRDALPAVTGAYVFTVAGWLPHKNPLALIDAWGRVPADVRSGRQLVLTCAVPPEAHGLVAARVAAAGLQPAEVQLTGRVDDELLRDLYRGAELFVFASLYEGFGLPVLEAARCGTPAIASATTATGELLADAAAAFDPVDPDAIAAATTAALSDPARRAHLAAVAQRAAATHTWEAVAARAAAAYGRLEGTGRARRARPRRAAPAPARVALLSPMPPAPSGAASYTARVAATLGRLVELDVYAEAAPWSDGARPHRQYPVAALGQAASPFSYDAVVHVVGNSDQHVATLAEALAHPGVCWMHEVDLSALGRLAGHPTPATLAEDLAASARGVIVHTAGAAARLRARLGVRCPPVEVVPLGVPSRAELGVDAPGAAHPDEVDDDDRPIVACFGIVDPAKQPDVVLEAFAAADEGGRHRLVFVGPADEPHRSDLLAHADRLGVARRVLLTGHVTARRYAAWLRRAEVAVQLRAATGGEASGTVLDAIGAGVPVLTSVASARELPAGVACVLPVRSPARHVAPALAELLRDDAARDAMRGAQAAYARTWTTADVARRIAELLAQPAWQGVGGAGTT